MVISGLLPSVCDWKPAPPPPPPPVLESHAMHTGWHEFHIDPLFDYLFQQLHDWVWSLSAEDNAMY